MMRTQTIVRSAFLALGLAAAIGAAAQARDDERPLDSTALRASVDGANEMWPFEIYMDGAAYTWRIHFPSDVQYDGYLVAVREGSGPWNILDSRGRIRLDSASEGLLNALSSSASFKQYSSKASPLEQGMPEDSAYYFPGWQAKDFQLARAPSNGHEAFTPLTSQRMIEQVLPSPALLNPQGPVTAYVALKRKGSTSVDGLVITTEAEYVTGERAFFAKAAYAGKSYVQKASALLASTFQAGNGLEVYEQAALESNPGLAMSAADWTMFAADSDLATMQHRLLTQFLNTMLGAAQNVDDIKVFEGADKPTWFEAMYGVNRIPYVASYLRYIYDARQPLYVAAMEESYPAYDYSKYLPLSLTEGAELARAALRYATWGTDYAMPTKGDSVPVKGPPVYLANKGTVDTWTTSVNGTNSLVDYAPGTSALDMATVAGASGLPSGWSIGLGADSPYAGGTAGSPLPYARGGIDGPRTFAMAMRSAYGSARKPGYALPPVGVGVDGMGLVTGAIAMTSYANAVEALDSGYPALSLGGYYRSGTKPSGVARFTRSDLEKISIVVPDLSSIQVGDLVVHYGEGEGKYGDGLEVGVVVAAPALGRPVPGQDPSSYLKTVVVVGASEEQRQVSLSTWLSNGQSLGLSNGTGNFHLRRLLRVAATTGLGPAGNLITKASFGFSTPRALKVDRSKASIPAYAVTVGWGGRDAGIPMRIGRPNAESASGSKRALGFLVAGGTTLPPAKVAGKVNSKMLRFGVTYDRSIESTMNPKQGDWRWIPNTGEYLVVEGLKVVVYNAEDTANAQPIDFAENTKGIPVSVQLGAVDRDYGAGVSEGNIYNNQGSGFEVAFLKDDNATGFWPAYDFNKESGADYTVSYDPTNTLNTPIISVDGKGSLGYSKIPRFGTNQDVKYNYLGIRPLPDSIRPGDDIQLEVKILLASQISGDTRSELSAITDAGKYFAVYDKKALWRANLYISEGADDWNNAHPWDVPPAVGKSVAGGAIPAWWSPTWGYNEWNRKWVEGTKIGDIANLNPADGTQNGILPLGALHPYRWIDNTENKNVVAYDYNSQDSPFEFNAKLEEQRSIMGSMYSPAKHLFAKAMIDWPADGIIDSLTSMSELEAFTFDEATWTGEAGFPIGTDVAKKLDYMKNKVKAWKNGTERSYYGTEPPGDSYWNYVHGASLGSYPAWFAADGTAPLQTIAGYSGGIRLPDGENAGIRNGGLIYPYVPGLSNTLDQVKRRNGWDAASDASADPLYDGGYAAGTDCVGFAMRSRSYVDQNGKTPYKWFRTFKALGTRIWGERLGVGTSLQTDGGGSIAAAYPYPKEAGKDFYVSATITSQLGKTAANGHLYKYLVPGDAYFWFTPGSNGWVGGHVAMIMNVSPEGDGTIIEKDISLVEAWDSGSFSVQQTEGYIHDDRTLLRAIDGKYNWILVRLLP